MDPGCHRHDDDDAVNRSRAQPVCLLVSPQQFCHTHSIQAHDKMSHAVVVIALEPKEIAHAVKGHQFKGVVRTDNLHPAPQKDEEVGTYTQFQPLVKTAEDRSQYKYHAHFRPPHLRVVGVDG